VAKKKYWREVRLTVKRKQGGGGLMEKMSGFSGYSWREQEDGVVFEINVTVSAKGSAG